MKSHGLDDAGLAEKTSNSVPGLNKLPVSAALSRRENAGRVRGQCLHNIGRPERIPRPLPDERYVASPPEDFLDAGGIFLGRNALDYPRFNFCDAAVGFGFPRSGHRRVHTAVPSDQDAINQFRHDFNRHVPGLFDDLIQCHRHGLNLAHLVEFDNLEAEAEEKTSETVIQKIFDELPVP